MSQPITIYENGVILPMTGEDDRLEAVAVQGETILAVGSSSQVRAAALAQGGGSPAVVDLKGRTMLPGFYDAHSHFSTSGLTHDLYVDLNSAPIGAMTCIGDYVAALSRKRAASPAGTVILGTGYDDSTILERRHPNRFDLDRVSTEQPVLVNHYTAHFMAVNTYTLKLLGIDRHTPDVPGGVIFRDENGDPTGVLGESAVFPVWNCPELNIFGTPQQRLDALGYASEAYAAKGITTVNEGSIANLADYKAALAAGKLKLRANLWFAPDVLLDPEHPPISDTTMLTIGGGKAFQDGSIQCRTACLTRPYHDAGEFGDPDCRGERNQSREALAEIVARVHRAGHQMFIHANGDGAIDDVLWAYEKAMADHPREDCRHVVVHAQTARMDQLEKMKELGVIPTFLVPNLYYSGERFRDVFLGPERAENANPIRWALDLGLPATIHCDTPVLPQDPLLSIYEAVTRRTVQGNVISAPQRITVYEALMAHTCNAAYQNKEEDRKGVIAPGRFADFVVLDRDPLQVPPEELKDIQVVKTIVGNQVVFEK